MATCFVPTIDVAAFRSPEHRCRPVAQLRQAAAETGFFHVTGHDISESKVQEAFNTGRRFRDLPSAVKSRYPFIPDRYLGWRSQEDMCAVTGNNCIQRAGFGRFGLGGYDCRKQEFVGEIWPSELGQQWRIACLSIQQQMHEVASQILQGLALALGRDATYFDQHLDFHSELNPSFMAWNWYSPVSVEAGSISQGPRLHGHADHSLITLLFQRPGEVGLEIAPGKDVDANPELDKPGNPWNTMPEARSWTAVDPKPGCILVNIGDALAWWSDGVFKSTYHRVRAPSPSDPQGPRESMPYFVFPELTHEFQGPAKKYPPMTAFKLLSETGNAFEARKNDALGSWKRKAYEAVQPTARQYPCKLDKA